MALNFSLDNFWGTGDSSAGTDQFFTPMWSDRTENTYSDFFKGGGWKKPGEWLNPGGVMANPAQQLADPGDFFTTGEHKNWVNKGEVSDRTLASAAAAALAYGGGSALSGMGGASSVGGSTGGGVSGSMGMGSDAASLAAAEAGMGAGGGWWSSLMNWLGGGGDGIMADQGALSKLLGDSGQSFSASDPTSWQYMLGGQASQAGENQQYVDLINAMMSSRRQEPKAPEVKKGSDQINNPFSPLGGLGSLGQGDARTPGINPDAYALLSQGG